MEKCKGIILGGFNINNIGYADDIVLIANSQEKLQEMVDIFVKYSEEKGLSVNFKKTECMIVTKNQIISGHVK